MRTFRAATLNIWSRFGPWEERLVAIRARPPRARARRHRHAGGAAASRTSIRPRSISEGLGYESAWGLASENHGFPTGNAILSRWPIARREVIALPNGGSDEQRSIVFAELASPFGKVPVFCTHLNWKLHHGHVRQLQVKALAEAVARLAPDRRLSARRGGRLQRRARLRRDPLHARPHRPRRPLRVLCRRLRRRRRRLARHHVLQAEPLRRSAPRAGAAHRLRLRAGPGRLAARRAHGGLGLLRQPHEGTFPSDHFGVIATITAGR